ncbi:outer membrane beta-barrel protein [Salmonirosea aquatica]|uniref:Outer membrane beta-barrel protein n=1 Tax=Salmonirosea aquatica TaxID=2654236 RepID=A0A7C9BIA5_9BACT|nr:outer membrane beta-barrel protein [Cytophagaceae bacterium SJW1-29]
MQKLLSILLLQLPLFVCYGQKTEISVQIHSGFSTYGGKSATATPSVFINDTGPPFYLIDSPYGKKSEFPYGFALQAQRLSSKNLLLGIRMGYDRFSTISHFDSYGAMGGRSSVEDGEVNLQTDLLWANPYFGYRLPVKNVRLDITAGFNVGSILKSTYIVSYENQSDFFEKQVDNYRINTKMDFGPTAGVSAEYKMVGIQASYCYGLVNYMRGLEYLPNAQAWVYSRYLRLGMSYRVK